MYMYDIKLFLKNKKELEILIHAVRIYCHSIGMKVGIKKLCHASNEMWEMTPEWRNGTTKSRQN